MDVADPFVVGNVQPEVQAASPVSVGAKTLGLGRVIRRGRRRSGFQGVIGVAGSLPA
jgi:hypothetical protein